MPFTALEYRIHSDVTFWLNAYPAHLFSNPLLSLFLLLLPRCWCSLFLFFTPFTLIVVSFFEVGALFSFSPLEPIAVSFRSNDLVGVDSTTATQILVSSHCPSSCRDFCLLSIRVFFPLVLRPCSIQPQHSPSPPGKKLLSIQTRSILFGLLFRIFYPSAPPLCVFPT